MARKKTEEPEEQSYQSQKQQVPITSDMLADWARRLKLVAEELAERAGQVKKLGIKPEDTKAFAAQMENNVAYVEKWIGGPFHYNFVHAARAKGAKIRVETE